MFSLHTLKCSSVHVILGQWSITEDLSYKGVHREAYYTNVPQQNVWYQLQATEQKIEKKKKKKAITKILAFSDQPGLESCLLWQMSLNNDITLQYLVELKLFRLKNI